MPTSCADWSAEGGVQLYFRPPRLGEVVGGQSDVGVLETVRGTKSVSRGLSSAPALNTYYPEKSTSNQRPLEGLRNMFNY